MSDCDEPREGHTCTKPAGHSDVANHGDDHEDQTTGYRWPRDEHDCHPAIHPRNWPPVGKWVCPTCLGAGASQQDGALRICDTCRGVGLFEDPIGAAATMSYLNRLIDSTPSEHLRSAARVVRAQLAMDAGA